MYEYKANIVRIVDGDTIDVDIDLGFDTWIRNERVRLSGIDTPESRTTDKVEKLFGLLAKERVEKYFNLSNDIILISKSYEKGKYGRILADFKINNTTSTLCETLVNEGHAVVYAGQSKDAIINAHLLNRARLLNEGVVTQAEIDLLKG